MERTTNDIRIEVKAISKHGGRSEEMVEAIDQALASLGVDAYIITIEGDRESISVREKKHDTE